MRFSWLSRKIGGGKLGFMLNERCQIKLAAPNCPEPSILCSYSILSFTLLYYLFILHIFRFCCSGCWWANANIVQSLRPFFTCLRSSWRRFPNLIGFRMRFSFFRRLLLAVPLIASAVAIDRLKWLFCFRGGAFENEVITKGSGQRR